MHLNISQLNKEVQEQGPELQFRTISVAKPIEAGPSKLSQQLTHTLLLQTSHLNHLLRPTFFRKCFSRTQKRPSRPLKVSRTRPVVLTQSAEVNVGNTSPGLHQLLPKWLQSLAMVSHHQVEGHGLSALQGIAQPAPHSNKKLPMNLSFFPPVPIKPLKLLT